MLPKRGRGPVGLQPLWGRAVRSRIDVGGPRLCPTNPQGGEKHHTTSQGLGASSERPREVLKALLTRGELAEESGVARDHIGRLERGEIPGESRMGTIRKLAAALKVDPADQLGGE
jgi:hypothetical protein